MLYFRLLLVLIFFQPLTSALGQNIFLKGGINVSSIAGVPEERSLIGYHVGIGGIRDISSNFSIRHELIFSQQGTRVSADHKVVYFYLNMPILFNAHLGHNFFLAVGPQAGIPLRGVEKGERDTYVTSNLRTIDISVCLVVSYFISVNFFVEGRYNVGVTNLSRISGSEHRNAVFQGSVGYYFNRKSQDSK